MSELPEDIHQAVDLERLSGATSSGRKRGKIQNRIDLVQLTGTTSSGRIRNQITNRTDLVQCCTDLLKKLWEENAEKDETLLELTERLGISKSKKKPRTSLWDFGVSQLLDQYYFSLN